MKINIKSDIENDSESESERERQKDVNIIVVVIYASNHFGVSAECSLFSKKKKCSTLNT